MAELRLVQALKAWQLSLEQDTPENERMFFLKTKRDYFNLGNTSEPTIDFSGNMLVFREVSLRLKLTLRCLEKVTFSIYSS